MPKTHNCPDCDMVLNAGAHACGCGWREEGAKSVSYPLGYRQCDWRSNGLRCKYPGTMSSNTLGDGPWYCSPHFDGCSVSMGHTIVTASQEYRHWTHEERMAETQAEAAAYCKQMGLVTVGDMRQHIKEITAKLAAKMTGVPANSKWALLILERMARGERMPLRSEECAREALGRTEREPGQDDEESDATAREAIC